MIISLQIRTKIKGQLMIVKKLFRIELFLYWLSYFILFEFHSFFKNFILFLYVTIFNNFFIVCMKFYADLLKFEVFTEIDEFCKIILRLLVYYKLLFEIAVCFEDALALIRIRSQKFNKNFHFYFYTYFQLNENLPPYKRLVYSKTRELDQYLFCYLLFDGAFVIFFYLIAHFSFIWSQYSIFTIYPIVFIFYFCHC